MKPRPQLITDEMRAEAMRARLHRETDEMSAALLLELANQGAKFKLTDVDEYLELVRKAGDR